MIQGLQVIPVPDNGYFEEPVGPVRLADHFHSFTFSISIDRLAYGYKILVSNRNMIETHSSMLEDRLTKQIFNNLDGNLEKIKGILDKITYKRARRGLVNALGTVIKFITGNPDDHDLQTIQENLEKIRATTNSEIFKLNQLTSLASHVTQRFAIQTEILNKNLELTRNSIIKLGNIADFRFLIQNEVYQSESLLNTLTMIERTLSMSMFTVPNLELITRKELLDIQNYLKKIYGPNQIFQNNEQQLFRTLDSAKFSILGINNIIVFILKIPIFKPITANYTKIYPLPNNQDLILIPPRAYLIKTEDATLWTDETCQTVNRVNICVHQPIQDDCLITSLSQCIFAKAKNNYEIVHVLQNNQLLTSFKNPREVLEDCNGLISRKTIQGSNILSSSCRIVIDSSVYQNSVPSYTIDMPQIQPLLKNFTHEVSLQLKHLSSPTTLLEDAQPIQSMGLSNFANGMHFTITGVTIACILVLIVFLVKFRHRVSDLFFKPRTIIHLTTSNASIDHKLQMNEGVHPS